MVTVTVRAAKRGDIPGLARSLTRAMEQDPFVVWLTGDAPDRLARMEAGWSAYLRHAAAGLETTWTTEDLAGAAIWVGPGRKPSGLLDGILQVPGMARWVGWRRLSTVTKALAELERHRSQAVAEPHAYLAVLGVTPERRGMGVGQALVTPMLERCDREGISALLESANPRNQSLYRRLGFEVVEELRSPRIPVVGWLMRRDPVGHPAPAITPGRPRSPGPPART